MCGNEGPEKRGKSELRGTPCPMVKAVPTTDLFIFLFFSNHHKWLKCLPPSFPLRGTFLPLYDCDVVVKSHASMSNLERRPVIDRHMLHQF